MYKRGSENWQYNPYCTSGEAAGEVRNRSLLEVKGFYSGRVCNNAASSVPLGTAIARNNQYDSRKDERALSRTLFDWTNDELIATRAAPTPYNVRQTWSKRSFLTPVSPAPRRSAVTCFQFEGPVFVSRLLILLGMYQTYTLDWPVHWQPAGWIIEARRNDLVRWLSKLSIRNIITILQDQLSSSDGWFSWFPFAHIQQLE